MRGSLRRRDRRQHVTAPERWELRVYLARDERGHKKDATKAFSGTRREAERALAALVTEIERGRRQRSSRMPFGDYAKQWIESRKAAAELAIKN
jgi:hypothetical protein